MEKKDILVLIPMKSIDKAKSRLRKSFSDEDQPKISQIIFKLFLNTLISVKENSFDFAVVSPSDDTLDIALDNNASLIYQDDGLDLNLALKSS